jgi:hypothetical protein
MRSIEHFGTVEFNFDRRLGGLLYRILSCHPDRQSHSLQQFVDCNGRGSFLRPLSILCYVDKGFMLPKALSPRRNPPFSRFASNRPVFRSRKSGNPWYSDPEDLN